jgi:hypothetical protein
MQTFSSQVSGPHLDGYGQNVFCRGTKMAHVQVVRPRTVTIVQCDCGCGAECESDFPDANPENTYTSGHGCGWISAHPAFHSLLRERLGYFNSDPGTMRMWNDAVPLYFVNYRCLAHWATKQAQIREIQVQALREQKAA